MSFHKKETEKIELVARPGVEDLVGLLQRDLKLGRKNPEQTLELSVVGCQHLRIKQKKSASDETALEGKETER